jgi:hypothetical protein
MPSDTNLQNFASLGSKYLLWIYRRIEGRKEFQMNTSLLWIPKVIIIMLIINSGCNSETPTQVACPPIGSGKKMIASDNPGCSCPNDGSSIEVFSSTWALLDDGSPWCAKDLGQLSITSVNLNSLPPCPYTKCLAAVDVKPDNLSFTTKSTSRPQLSYDLDEHQPAIRPEECTQGTPCYAIYQLKTNTWQSVGYANPVILGTEWFAQGNIKHFSIFALVELPPPNPVNGPRRLGTFIASEFIDDDMGGNMVSLNVYEDDSNELNQYRDQRIYRFVGIDLIGMDREIKPDCLNLDTLAEQFTCLFPIDTEVEIIIGLDGIQNEVLIRSLNLNIEAHFAVNYVEVY